MSIAKILKNTLLILMAVVGSVSAETQSDSVRYCGAELSNVVLSSKANSGKVVYAAPGESIRGNADFTNHRPLHYNELFQIVVGIDGIGGQDACQWTHHYWGYSDIENQLNWDFTMTAPMAPGIYEVRFSEGASYTIEDAIENFGEPSWQSTIGLIIVSKNPKKDVREINDSNWKQWHLQKHATQEDEVVEALPLLTSEMISEPGFWDSSRTKGKWKIDGNILSNQGTQRFYEDNHVLSKSSFEQFQLTVTENFQYKKNPDKNSRGFAVLYYVNDQMSVEFRYFPDVGQLSLYIRDHEKLIECMKKVKKYQSGQDIVHNIEIVEGQIQWHVNGDLIFNETTTLTHGRLMLTNFNNSVTFQF